MCTCTRNDNVISVGSCTPQRACAEGYSTQLSVVSVYVCVSVTSIPGRAAIEMLQLQSQRCLNNALECLNWPDFLIKAWIRKHVTY